MIRRLALFLPALAVLPLVSPARPVGAAEPRPNILIIVTDDQRYEGTQEVMPRTVGWFRGGGTAFANAFVTTPLCCPSRATIMSGQYAHNHGVHDNYSFSNLDHLSTVQRYLHDAGYITGVVGKFFNIWPLADPPPFFDRWAICAPCGYEGRPFSLDGAMSPIQRYSTTFIGERAVGFLEQFEEDDERPWYLYIAPFAPHAPATPSRFHRTEQVPRWVRTPAAGEKNTSDKPAFVSAERVPTGSVQALRRRQLRSLISVDEMVGVITETLAGLGEDGNTLAIFMSDNGMMWHDHGLVGKRYPYTESIQIPLYMRWPGRVPAGESTARLVANVDIAPTIMEAAGLSPDLERPMDGRPLLANPARETLFLEHWSDTHRGFTDWASLRTATYQYAEYYGRDRDAPIFTEYYDLTEDPWQLDNLLGDSDEDNDPDTSVLSALLEAASLCRGAACP